MDRRQGKPEYVDTGRKLAKQLATLFMAGVVVSSLALTVVRQEPKPPHLVRVDDPRWITQMFRPNDIRDVSAHGAGWAIYTPNVDSVPWGAMINRVKLNRQRRGPLPKMLFMGVFTDSSLFMPCLAWLRKLNQQKFECIDVAGNRN